MGPFLNDYEILIVLWFWSKKKLYYDWRKHIKSTVQIQSWVYGFFFIFASLLLPHSLLSLSLDLLCSALKTKEQNTEHIHWQDVARKETATTDQQNNEPIGDKVRSQPSRRIWGIINSAESKPKPHGWTIRFQRSTRSSSRRSTAVSYGLTER